VLIILLSCKGRSLKISAVVSHGYKRAQYQKLPGSARQKAGGYRVFGPRGTTHDVRGLDHVDPEVHTTATPNGSDKIGGSYNSTA